MGDEAVMESQVQEEGQGYEGTPDDAEYLGEEVQDEQVEQDVEDVEGGEDGSWYEPEEFLGTHPLEVDASRLPRAAKLVHDRYMEVYRRETAPALEELGKLRAFRDEVLAGRVKPQSAQPEDPAQQQKSFLARVREEAKRALGVGELDEFNVDHTAMVALMATRLGAQEQDKSSQEAARTEAVRRVEELNARFRAQDPDFAHVDRFGMEQLGKMPYEQAVQVMNDLQSGDPARIERVYVYFSRLYKESVKPKGASMPPKVISGSVVQQKGGSAWGIDDFGRASSKEQAKMLMTAGLV